MDDLAAGFGRRQFGDAALGDARRTARLVSLADTLVAHPAGTFPQKLPADELKALYRLLDADDVTHASVLASHFAATQARLAAFVDPVLILHDTTVLDYSGLHAVETLGPIGDGHGRGYYCHNSLAVAAGTRAVFGLVAQTLHRRRVVPRGETKAQRHARPDRESLLWGNAVASLPPLAPSQTQIDVADRGADVLEFLDALTVAGRRYVVRSQHDRRVQTAESAVEKLHTVARARPSQGTREVPLSATADRPARVATLSVSWTRVALLPPRQPCGHARDIPHDVDVVRVWEPTPPNGTEPIEWLLLTNLPVESLDDAIARIEWYATRWVIEEYHKAMKTGVSIEALQFRSADTLEPAIAILSVVAVALLALRDASRNPATTDHPATTVVPPLGVRLLSQWKTKKPHPDWTVAQFFLALAQLGGYGYARKSKPPGWIVLWRGWIKLQTFLDAAELFAPDG